VELNLVQDFFGSGEKVKPVLQVAVNHPTQKKAKAIDVGEVGEVGEVDHNSVLLST